MSGPPPLSRKANRYPTSNPKAIAEDGYTNSPYQNIFGHGYNANDTENDNAYARTSTSTNHSNGSSDTNSTRGALKNSPIKRRPRLGSNGSTRGAFEPLPEITFTSPRKTSPRKTSPRKTSPRNRLSQAISPPEGPQSNQKSKSNKRAPKTPTKYTPTKVQFGGSGNVASLAVVGLDTPEYHPTPPSKWNDNHNSAIQAHPLHASTSHNTHGPTRTSTNTERTSASSEYGELYIGNLDNSNRTSIAITATQQQQAYQVTDLRYSNNPFDPDAMASAVIPEIISRQQSLQSRNSSGLAGMPYLEDLQQQQHLDSLTSNNAADQRRIDPNTNQISMTHGSTLPTDIQKQQQFDISRFSSMVQGSQPINMQQQQQQQHHDQIKPPQKSVTSEKGNLPHFEYENPTNSTQDEGSDYDDEDYNVYEDDDEVPTTFFGKVWYSLDPNVWLAKEVIYYEKDGTPIEDVRNIWNPILSLIRLVLYNPETPEFTSLQQFSWATLLGIVMGIYTAVWKNLIECCVEFMWKTVPQTLYEWGFFTDLNGLFPLPHYMWICPSVCGGILSYIFCILPKQIPGQNEWIQALHARGVLDHETFWNLFFLSTAGMASGLSLGPELPLVLTAGMIGSRLGVVTRQSILSARAMNLTAASAAVAGFFGFPMAGALFVLEIPHRMGLQYFEALSPATFASIVAVLVNRMVLKNDVTGYYDYPFLTTSLPAHIFYIAIFYGLVGSAVGVFYVKGVLNLKKAVNDWFRVYTDDHRDSNEGGVEEHINKGQCSSEVSHGWDGDGAALQETKRLLHKISSLTQIHENKLKPDLLSRIQARTKKIISFGIHHEPHRAAAAGMLAGFLTGVTCMFVPHVLFWGEAQLQTLIDNGRTPLPVFGQGDEPTADLIAYGFCLIDPNDAPAIAAGMNIGCAAVITLAKVFVVGLSLGTGIVGGHFWGPLFVGCSACYFLIDVCRIFSGQFGIGERLTAYPTVAMLCIMGASHVVAFRAHTAIMLILTLTISAFTPEGLVAGYTAGDYSAVFPLLVVSCFISLMVTRDTIFYKAQRCRGDIMASPEVLCEPGKEGQPLAYGYEDDFDDDDYCDETSDVDFTSDGNIDDYLVSSPNNIGSSQKRRPDDHGGLTPSDIEDAFFKVQQATVTPTKSMLVRQGYSTLEDLDNDLLSEMLGVSSSSPTSEKNKAHRRVRSTSDINPCFPAPMNITKSARGHVRNKSESSSGNRSRVNSSSNNTPAALRRVCSFGEVSEFQPSLFIQARLRASSASRVRRPSLPKSGGRHSRTNSDASIVAIMTNPSEAAGALSNDDVERSFSSVVNQQSLVSNTSTT